MAHQISEVSGRAEIVYAGDTPGARARGESGRAPDDVGDAAPRRPGVESWALQPVCRQGGRSVEGFRFTVREDCDVLGVVTEHYHHIRRSHRSR